MGIILIIYAQICLRVIMVITHRKTVMYEGKVICRTIIYEHKGP